MHVLRNGITGTWMRTVNAQGKSQQKRAPVQLQCITEDGHLFSKIRLRSQLYIQRVVTCQSIYIYRCKHYKMRCIKEFFFVLTGVFICVILVWAARHHPPNDRKTQELWHDHWESESNATMLRSVPHVKDHKPMKPYELSEHTEFDLRLVSSVKECSTKQLSECIKPGRLITDWETEKSIIRFFDNSVRNVRRFIYKKPRDPLIYIDKCQHVEYSIDKNKGYTKLMNAKSININWAANRGTKWVYAKCMDNQRSGQPELNHLIYPTTVNKQLKEDRPNVVVLQIDGMSYRQYQSLYTETQTVLKSLNSRTFSFQNYWANGYNSPPNMKRMYCDDKSCDSSHILKHFQQAGFETSWILEYTYGLMGYPFDSSGSRYVDKLFAGNYYNKNWKSDLTDMVGGFAWDEYCYMKSLRYLDLFLRDNGLQKNSKTGSHVAIVVPNVAHSSERMRAKQMDNALATLLRDWDRDGLMSNTIFCIVSDHGIHGSPINIFLAGEFEHRNPVFEMIVPKPFLQKHPNVETYLKHNTNAIITHFDFYKSIASLANVQTWRPAAGTIKKATEQKKYNIFMDKIPMTRTCQQAGIPDEWCNCWGEDRE